MDQSSVTININIGGVYTGSNVLFENQRDCYGQYCTVPEPHLYNEEESDQYQYPQTWSRDLNGMEANITTSIINGYLSVPHKLGYAIIHVGQHWHSTDVLESGERGNLVIWARSSRYLRSPAENYAADCDKDCFATNEYDLDL